MRKAMTSEAKAWTFGLACSLPWLLIPGWAMFADGHGAARWWGVACIVVLSLLVVISPVTASLAADGQRAVWILVAAQIVVALVMTFAAPSATPGMLIYPGIVAASAIERGRRVFALLVALALLAASVPLWATGPTDPQADGDPAWMSGLLVIALGGWMLGFAQNVRDNEELKRTRGLLANAAVAAERERIAHDLHDILGHSLTAISVQASVVRRLAESSTADAAIVEHARAIEEQARAALSDVRATAAGLRDTSLAGELAIARQTLNSAGVDVDLPTALDHVVPAGRAVFGFVLREAVTNVVRHSGATHCAVRIGERSIEVRDNGAGAADIPESDAAAEGHGLRGLAWRLGAIGGTVSYGSDADGGFVVRAEVPDGQVPETVTTDSEVIETAAVAAEDHASPRAAS